MTSVCTWPLLRAALTKTDENRLQLPDKSKEELNFEEECGNEFEKKQESSDLLTRLQKNRNCKALHQLLLQNSPSPQDSDAQAIKQEEDIHEDVQKESQVSGVKPLPILRAVLTRSDENHLQIQTDVKSEDTDFDFDQPLKKSEPTLFAYNNRKSATMTAEESMKEENIEEHPKGKLLEMLTEEKTSDSVDSTGMKSNRSERRSLIADNTSFSAAVEFSMTAPRYNFCQACFKKFSKKSSRKRRQLTQAGNRSVEMCSLKYCYRSRCRQTERSATGRYICAFCGRKFSSDSVQMSSNEGRSD